MKKQQLIFGILLIAAIALGACAPAVAPTTAPAQAEPTHKVAMVLPGVKTDEAFNQYTYEGMMRAAKDFGVEGHINATADVTALCVSYKLCTVASVRSRGMPYLREASF